MFTDQEKKNLKSIIFTSKKYLYIIMQKMCIRLTNTFVFSRFNYKKCLYKPTKFNQFIIPLFVQIPTTFVQHLYFCLSQHPAEPCEIVSIFAGDGTIKHVTTVKSIQARARQFSQVNYVGENRGDRGTYYLLPTTHATLPQKVD